MLASHRVRTGLAVTAALALVGCGIQPGAAPGSAPGAASPAPEAPAAAVTIPEPGTPVQPPAQAGPAALTVSVADGAKAVPVDSLITVTPNRGRISAVEVSTTASGQNAARVTGSVNTQGVWIAHTRLDPGASYTVAARGSAEDGTELSARSSFTTATLPRSREVFPTLTPIQGGPFGIAQPVVVQFDLPVAERAEFERHLTVTTSPIQEGSWGWISDNEVHYRPREYWQPGTRIHLDANLNGVTAGNGTYGQLNRTLELTIGRRQSTKVDLQAKQLTFTRDGQEPQTFGISAGKEGFTTRSGHKVIMEKADSTRMDSETTGISNGSAEGYDMNVSWALRLTSSGEFFHAAPWNQGRFGRENASHGCTGMSTKDAYSYYQQAQIGDPVEFSGSDRQMEWGNGWSEWNLSWEQWRERSALA